MYTRAALLACALTAAAAPAPEAEPVHVPLTRERLGPRADGSVDWAGFMKELNHTLQKYNKNAYLQPQAGGILDDLLEERGVGTVPLTDQGNDLLYYGNIKVGTAKKQTYTIDFDTGSSDLFVPGPHCPSCHGTPYSEQGVNQGNTTSVTYGSGQVSGKNFFDTICAGGLCAKHTNLISLRQSQGFATSKSDGLMGMGFSTIANSKQPTFFERLMALGRVSKNEFSFYLGRAKSGTGQKSVMTLGGRDGSKFTGKPIKNKVTQKGYWQLAIDGLNIDGTNAILGAGQAAIDTGTTVIIAPTVATTLFAAQFNAVPVPIAATGSPTLTAFAYDCGSTKQVSAVFGGKKYSISAVDLNLGRITPALAGNLPVPGLRGLCFLSVIAGDLGGVGSNLYVVGDTFLKNWYSIYSYDNGGSVSFAKAK